MNTPLPCLALVLAVAGSLSASPVSGSFDSTFASRYVTHGFNVGDTEAQQATLNLTAEALPGFTLTYWNSLTLDRTLNAFDEHDLLLKYNRSFLQGERAEIALSSYIDYWWYPQTTIQGNNLQGLKYHAGLSLPNAIALPDGFSLVPGYNFYHWHDYLGDQFNEGAVHECFLQAEVPLGLSGSSHVPQSIGLRATLNYNTGFLGVESGLSHATLHLTTGAALTDWLSWHLSLDHQWTLEDQLNGNGDDISWFTLGLNASF